MNCVLSTFQVAKPSNAVILPATILRHRVLRVFFKTPETNCGRAFGACPQERPFWDIPGMRCHFYLNDALQRVVEFLTIPVIVLNSYAESYLTRGYSSTVRH
eukprot:scaffold4642_cov112-Cylindrotheca_fusiformis.AAC.7